jgi:hypothetical protein
MKVIEATQEEIPEIPEIPEILVFLDKQKHNQKIIKMYHQNYQK